MSILNQSIFGGSGGGLTLSESGMIANVSNTGDVTVTKTLGNNYDNSKTIIYISCNAFFPTDAYVTGNVLTLKGTASQSSYTNIYYTVYQFDGIKSIQKGTRSSYGEVTITPVNRKKSMIFCSSMQTALSWAIFVNDSKIEIQAANSRPVLWYVVEFN